MKVAIVGSRYFVDLEMVRKYVRSLPAETIVVSGGAMGVDRAAEFEAAKLGLTVISHKADWATDGRAAGMIRNHHIVADADRLVAFWDGSSHGTKNSIDRARSKGIPVEVFCQ
jgi:YspA, cpYpsA-related SLOG family